MVGWYHWLLYMSWVNSGPWWWTGRPGVLQFMGWHRVGHDWMIELNWTDWLKLLELLNYKGPSGNQGPLPWATGAKPGKGEKAPCQEFWYPCSSSALCVCGDLGSWDEAGRAQWGLSPLLALWDLIQCNPLPIISLKLAHLDLVGCLDFGHGSSSQSCAQHCGYPAYVPGRCAAGNTIRARHRRWLLCQTGEDSVWEDTREPPEAPDHWVAASPVNYGWLCKLSSVGVVSAIICRHSFLDLAVLWIRKFMWGQGFMHVNQQLLGKDMACRSMGLVLWKEKDLVSSAGGAPGEKMDPWIWIQGRFANPKCVVTPGFSGQWWELIVGMRIKALMSETKNRAAVEKEERQGKSDWVCELTEV